MAADGITWKDPPGDAIVRTGPGDALKGMSTKGFPLAGEAFIFGADSAEGAEMPVYC